MTSKELQAASERIVELAQEVPKYGFGFVQDGHLLSELLSLYIQIAQDIGLDLNWVQQELTRISRFYSWKCNEGQEQMLWAFAELGWKFPWMLNK